MVVRFHVQDFVTINMYFLAIKNFRAKMVV